jgi:hypothetical protein
MDPILTALVALVMMIPRSDCEEMRGTQYRGLPTTQVVEREWFLSNCVVVTGTSSLSQPYSPQGWSNTPGSGYSLAPHSHLLSIRHCESRDDYGAVDPSLTYFGAYQFDLGTWESVGGVGYPHHASPAEQDARAMTLYSMRGGEPWPHCQYAEGW